MKTSTKTAATYPNFDASKSYIGECQVCGQFQVVKGGTLVLHGYNRPGNGYITGRCWGELHVPFQLSCEVAKDFHKHLVEKAIPGAVAHLAALKSPALAELEITVNDGYYARGNRGWNRALQAKTKIVTINPGYVHTKNAQNDYLAGTTFEQFRERAIRNQTLGIENLERDRDALARKIASWSYRPEALKTHETIKLEKAAATAEMKAERRFRGNWKDLWKRIAESIAEHKRSGDHVEETRDHASSWVGGAEILARVEESHKAKWGHLPPFPTNKQRAAARKGK